MGWGIQNKTHNDIGKLTYVIRSFILNTPHKNFFQSMVFQNSKKRRPHSPGQNFGALEYHTPKKNFMRSIQNETPDDITG